MRQKKRGEEGKQKTTGPFSPASPDFVEAAQGLVSGAAVCIPGAVRACARVQQTPIPPDSVTWPQHDAHELAGGFLPFASLSSLRSRLTASQAGAGVLHPAASPSACL